MDGSIWVETITTRKARFVPKHKNGSSNISKIQVFIIFKLNEDTLVESEKTNNAVKEKVAKAQETDISDSAQNEVIQEEPDEIENKNENLKIEEEEIAKVEESHNDDNMYYDIDSDSLINVFNNLENYQKNENEKQTFSICYNYNLT